MEIKEILKGIGRVLLIPVYGLVLIGVIISSFFTHKTIRQTLYDLEEPRE